MTQIEPRLCAVLVAAWALLLFHPAPVHASGAAATAETAWVPGELSKARLLAAGGLDSAKGAAHYTTALEIELVDDTHTYWRLPGDAGVPPVLSTAGSTNVKSASLLYPVPQRLEEAGLAVFGYTGRLLLPMRVEPKDPAKPVHLSVSFTYAACRKICIPASADMALELAPGAKASAHAGQIAEARALLPVRTQNGDAAKVDVAAERPGEKPAWRIKVDAPQDTWRDLFVEAPDGWYFESRKTDGGFELTAAEKPKSPSYPVPVTLTLDGAGRDFEISASLPAP